MPEINFVLQKTKSKRGKSRIFRSEKASQSKSVASTFSLENLFENLNGAEVKNLNVLVKADVRGSLEAITAALREIGNEEVKVNLVMEGVGAITESDANYAVTSGAVVFGFNVRADGAAKKSDRE